MLRRRTSAQNTVLKIIRTAGVALSHEDISERLTPPPGRVTLYRILNRFVEDGLAHRIVADDGRQYFASCEENCNHGRVDHGHLHFRCVACDRVECLPDPVEFQLPTGYRADHFNIMLSGTCAGCAAA